MAKPIKLSNFSTVNVVVSIDSDNTIYGYSVLLDCHKSYLKKMWFIKHPDGGDNLCCTKCGSLGHSASACHKDYVYVTMDFLEETLELYPSYIANEELFIQTYKI